MRDAALSFLNILRVDWDKRDLGNENYEPAEFEELGFVNVTSIAYNFFQRPLLYVSEIILTQKM